MWMLITSGLWLQWARGASDKCHAHIVRGHYARMQRSTRQAKFVTHTHTHTDTHLCLVQELDRLIGEWQLKLNVSAVRAQRTQGRDTHTHTKVFIGTHTQAWKGAHTKHRHINMNNYWIIGGTRTYTFSQCHSLSVSHQFSASLQCRAHTHTHTRKLQSPQVPPLQFTAKTVSSKSKSLFSPLTMRIASGKTNKIKSLRKAFIISQPVRRDLNGDEWKWLFWRQRSNNSQ